MGAMKGGFYGVGVGPGDPELMTLKAVRVLRDCPVIAAPRTRDGAMLALDIAAQAVDLKEKMILPLFFPMERDAQRLETAHRAAAEAVESCLEQGKDVAMLNLGDVSIYATYSYLMELLSEKGYETRMIPGVPSFCAVAARLGVSLTSMNAPLHILPAGGSDTEALLALPGTKILMKSGKSMARVAGMLEEKGLNAKAVQNCGLPGEAVWERLSAETPVPAGYFTTIVVKE